MYKQGKAYQCLSCGAKVEVLQPGGGLSCCGKTMEEVKPQKSGEKAPTHKPIIKKTKKGVKVLVGKIPHGMDPDHYISWIEVEHHGKVTRKALKPGHAPEAEFAVRAEKARAFCTTHGLWSSE